MIPPYRTFIFHWLLDSAQPDDVLRPEDGDTEWLAYPFPEGLGEGGFQKVELALGMSVFRGVHRFTSAAVGRLIPLAEVEVTFPEPTFMTQVVRGGRILHREMRPQAEVLFAPGFDLFRLSDQLHVIPQLEGSLDSEMTCLTVGIGMLGRLIGEDAQEALFAALELRSCPQVTVRPIPLHISTHLHGAIPHHLSGAPRRLYCQARMLDYLTALVDHLLGKLPPKPVNSPSTERARAIHDILMNSEGKLPALDELANRLGRSARVLNEEFAAAFGQSIVAFVTHQRLEAAHAAIVSGSTPLKVIAARLGYTHVNNFNAAFKRKFGYPPGSLRRK